MSDTKSHSDMRISARFKAKYLHALRFLLDSAEADFYRPHYGLSVEPEPAGGVILVATNGFALAAIHDENGFASAPFRAMLPWTFRARCALPPPIAFVDDADLGPVDLPEWAQPGDVLLSDLSALLFARQPRPMSDDGGAPATLARAPIATGDHWREGEYRIDAGPLPDWRTIFDAPASNAAPAPRAFISPELYGMFELLRELAATRNYGLMPAASLEYRGEGAPVIVTIDHLPNFIGAIAPMTPFDPPPPPDFLRRGEPTK
jgi:hypothetical protein